MPNKDVEDIIAALKRQGWRVNGRNKHYVAFPPNKDLSAVTIAYSPSDHRAIKNIISRCRNRGAEFE